MKTETRTIIIRSSVFLLFLAGIIIGDQNIVHDEIYNSFGKLLMMLALIIIIKSKDKEIASLKKRIGELKN